MLKRKVNIAVISDVHLGTIGCHATELLQYLNSIQPQVLVLNGDIVDIWQFSKRFWPQAHSRVIQKIIDFINQGVTVYYLTGNHDDALRKYSDFELAHFKLCDKVVLELDGKKAWIFHGDVFDVSINHARWLAKLGSIGYDTLILLNRLVNFLLQKAGKEKYSFSKRIKNSVKKAVSFIANFEITAAELAIEKGYDYVICGHIHQPQMCEYKNKSGKVLYLNSGDWIENLTALEYSNGQWSIYYHPPKTSMEIIEMETRIKSFTVFTDEISLAFQTFISKN